MNLVLKEKWKFICTTDGNLKFIDTEDILIFTKSEIENKILKFTKPTYRCKCGKKILFC